MILIFGDQSPSTPFVVIGLVIVLIFIGVAVVALKALNELWSTRHTKNSPARRRNIIILVIIGLIVLYEFVGLIYDKLKA